jgi:hypothetical protein
MGAIVANTNHLLADALMAAANKLYQPEPYKWRKSSEYPAVGTKVICYHKDTGGYLFGRREFGRWEAEVDGVYHKVSDAGFTHWTKVPEYYEEQ